MVVGLPKCPFDNIKCEAIVRFGWVGNAYIGTKSELCNGRSPFIAYSGADQQLDGEAPAADEPVLQRQHNSGVSVRGTPRPQSAACTSGEQLRPARTPVLFLQVC